MADKKELKDEKLKTVVGGDVTSAILVGLNKLCFASSADAAASAPVDCSAQCEAYITCKNVDKVKAVTGQETPKPGVVVLK